MPKFIVTQIVMARQFHTKTVEAESEEHAIEVADTIFEPWEIVTDSVEVISTVAKEC